MTNSPHKSAVFLPGIATSSVKICDKRFVTSEQSKDRRVLEVYTKPREIWALMMLCSFADPNTANRRRKRWRRGWHDHNAKHPSKSRRYWQEQMSHFRRTRKRTVAVRWLLTGGTP